MKDTTNVTVYRESNGQERVSRSRSLVSAGKPIRTERAAIVERGKSWLRVELADGSRHVVSARP